MSTLAPHPAASLLHAASGRLWPPETMAREIAGRAAALAARGVGPGARVVIAHGGTPDFFADLFALWRLGAVAAPINPQLTRHEIGVLADFARPALFLTGDGGADLAGVKVPVIDLREERGSTLDPSPARATDAPALVLFTSGTTGSPKGVVLGRDAIAARLALNRRHIGDAALARALCLLPTHFGHGLIGNCLTPLAAGGRLVLAPQPGIGELGRLGATIDEFEITFLSSVPSLWKIALKASRPPARGTLRRLHVGSAPLSAELWRQIGGWAGAAEVFNMYGITETANWIAGIGAREAEPADGLVGRMWGGEAAVLEPGGARREAGSGEIVVRTPSLMAGYLDRPDLTRAVIDGGWFHTGDLGEIDKAGRIRLAGRIKLEINRAGMKVSPEEVELVLEGVAGVAEACVLALPDPVAGEIVGAAVALAPGATRDAAALRAACAQRLRRDCVPERWFFLDAIPKTDRGKVDRQAVLAACLRRRG